jgi:hypothetical protein
MLVRKKKDNTSTAAPATSASQGHVSTAVVFCFPL